ncbi:MAG: M18 family aminopeptidase [Rhodobacter sp.]|nr:M18 family aminopeptidase [Rhodobacter sp.]
MNEFLAFLNNSPSPYHAIDWMRQLLKKNGFTQASEGSSWADLNHRKSYLCRDDKSLIAWLPGSSTPLNTGFRVIGAHADSPALKPRSNRISIKSKVPVLEVGVYGSPLLHTWLDREFGLAGQIYTRAMPGGSLFVSRSINLRTASLAIHLDRDSRSDGLKLSPQEHINCIVSDSSYHEGNDLIDLVANEIGVDRSEVLALDLSLFDRHPAQHLSGSPGFLSGGRLDNLLSCFCAVSAMLALQAVPASTIVIAIFDAEEIGSRTWSGAQSSLLSSTLERITHLNESAEQTNVDAFRRAIALSTLISVDAAHANHPFHPERLSPQSAPNLNDGVAIKKSDRGHYAVSARLEAAIVRVCREQNIPLQDFRYREDLGGGSSIGPIISSQLGIETIDAGVGLLGMHSARELMGSDDVQNCINFIKAAFTI